MAVLKETEWRAGVVQSALTSEMVSVNVANTYLQLRLGAPSAEAMRVTFSPDLVLFQVA